MSFTPRHPDDLQCHECGIPIALDEYRRFGLCPACEAERDAARIPDVVPEWMTKR